MNAAPTQTQGIAACMEHWFSASEVALDRAHDRRLNSAQRLEAFRLSSRAEARGNRLACLLRTDSAGRWVREAA